MLFFNLKTNLNYNIFLQLLLALERLLQGLDATWFKEKIIQDEAIALKAEGWVQFSLFLSPEFNALVLAGEKLSAPTIEGEKIDVGLTFEGEVIVAFCQQLSNIAEISDEQLTQIELACRNLQANDAKIQSEFTLILLNILSSNHLEASPEVSPEASLPTNETAYPSVSICQPIKNALQQQIKQEQLLYRVTTQIRQSLELPVILSTAVEEVRRCLEVDRLLIYEFKRDNTNHNSDESINNSSQVFPQTKISFESLRGCITYESRSSQDILSVLELDIEQELIKHLNSKDTNFNQFDLANDDIAIAYKEQQNVLEIMQIVQVRSELLSAIVVDKQLWGLLIAHQCSELRQWQENDQIFIRDIAEHLAIAIRQALLYRQLQLQKETLEQRFKNQTQDLRDALIAAEAANRSKSEFLAAMSHELRTPLTCVIGMSSTLLRWSFGQFSEKQRDYLKNIHDSGEHLLELINDILELSQLEAGKAVLSLQEISLIQLCQQMLASMREKARDADISLNTDFHIPPEGDLLIGDLRRIQQILYNLLSNAIKFTPAGGQVTIRLWAESQTILLQVEDTGVGIPLEDQSLIFNTFQQLDSSFHRNYEGTGLGLALTKQLVELHGGWINVTSQVGVGSLFTVELPIKQFNNDNASLPVSEPALNQSRYPGIVLIEEQQETATNFCDLLTEAGYQVVWILDGINALSNVELLEPNLVIIDTILSDIDPCDLIKDLRRIYTTEKLKILVLLTDTISEFLIKFWEAGADDYLIKPVQSQALLKKINALFQQ